MIEEVELKIKKDDVHRELVRKPGSQILWRRADLTYHRHKRAVIIKPIDEPIGQTGGSFA